MSAWRKRFEPARPEPTVPATCPICGPGTGFSEVDTVMALAVIVGFTGTGTPVWEGTTNVDWDSQRPAHPAPRFECSGCFAHFTAAQIGPRPALTAPGEFE